MPSRTSFFDLPLYKQVLRRWWFIAVLYAGGLSLLVLDATSEYLRQGRLLYARQSLLNLTCSFGGLAACAFALVTVMAVFSWMYNTRSAAYMTALPISRRSIFISQTLAGGTLLLSAQALAAAVYLLAGASAGCVDAVGAGMLFLLSASAGLLYYGFALFCAMLTGSTPILPCIFAIFNATAVVVEMLVQYIAEFMLYGLGYGVWGIEWLSPLFLQLTSSPATMEYAPDAQGVSRELAVHFQSGEMYTIFAAVGVVFLVLAWLLFRQRRMESAGETVAIRALRPIFRWCLALAFSLVGGVIYLALAFTSSAGHGTWGRVLTLLVCMLIAGGAGWVCAEMLIQRRLRPAGVHVRGLLLYSALLSCIVLLGKADVAGLEKRLPEEGEVTSVTVICPFYGLGADNRNLTDMTDPENIRQVLAMQEELIGRRDELMADPNGCNALTILWDLNGRSMTRVYYVRQEDASLRSRWQDIMNSETITGERLRLTPELNEYTFAYGYVQDYNGGVSVDMTVYEAIDFYRNCVLPDIADGTLGRVYLTQDEDYYTAVTSCTLHLGVQGGTKGEYVFDYLELQIPFDARRTVLWLRTHGLTPHAVVPEE